jgi:hypothetical protein
MRPRKTSGNNSLSKEADPLLSKEPESISKISVVKELIDELHVYQAELKVQNEELLRVKSEFKAYENRFRKPSLSKTIKLYWKYYVPLWLLPIYFCLIWFLFLNKINSNTFVLLLGIPFIPTWFMSEIPYWRNKVSFRVNFFLYLIDAGWWFACIITGLIIKTLFPNLG